MSRSHVRPLVIACSFVIAAIPIHAQAPAAPPPQTQAAQPAPTVPGGLNFSGASLLEVINLLAQDLHLNYIIDPSVRGGSVTMNTYGAVRDVDLRPLLETILRMNGLAMVQVGNIYRIVPMASIARQPVSPTSETDASRVPDDERIMLNLVFLRYVTSSEMSKILQPFLGDGAQMSSYDPANLLIILDNSRNMRRSLELISMFDSDTFAGQRVRPFEIKNSRPSDLVKELDEIFKAYALSNDKGAVHFLPIDRISTILAVAPNPGTFTEVENWINKLDIPAKITAGSIDNHVYKLKYARAEIIGSVIMQLYGGPPTSFGGIYGGIPGNSSYPASGAPGTGFGYPGGANGSPYGGGFGSPYGGGYGSPYGGNGGGFASPYGSPYGAYGAGAYGTPYGAYGTPMSAAPQAAVPATATGGAGTPATGTVATATTAPDQTGAFLGTPSYFGGRYTGPRVIPNPFDNTLLVQGTPEQWEQIRNLIERLDVPPRQVLIDAKIYEVDLTGDFSLGVESFLQKRGAGSPSAGVGNHQLTGSSNAGGNTQLLLSAGTLVGQSRELLALLEAQETTTKAKVLSAPSVVATDSIPASITVGDSVPTLTSQAINPGVTSGGNSLFTNTISNTSTGIGLTILARVNASGVVTMVINQDITAPVPTTTSNIDSPSFSQRNVSTQVTVEDGDTVAIGGIITESTTQTSSGIPVLSRIPYLGAAFGAKTSTKQRTELIIFLTPRVIYDTTQMADATEELKQKVRGLRNMIKEER